MEEEVVNEEIPTEEVVTEEPVEEKTVEELKAELEALKKKNESAEEIAKRLKDEKSQSKRQEVELTKQQQAEKDRTEFLTQALNDGIENGLTEEHFKLAKEKGITPEALELSLYKFKETINSVYEKAGGKDRYFEMVDAVSESVDERTASSYKKLLLNPETMDIALEALENRYNKLSGGSNSDGDVDNRIVAKTSIESSVSNYKSMEDYYADMRKLRKLPNGKQGEFRKQIEDKLNRSKLV